MDKKLQIGIIGTTTWATTLGLLFAKKGHTVILWARDKNEAKKLNANNENIRFLPGIKFPSNMSVTNSTLSAISTANITIFAVPSFTMEKNITLIKKHLNPNTIILSASKGLDPSGKRMTEVLSEQIKTANIPICAISGPNLATEIIKGKTCSMVIGSDNINISNNIQTIMNSNQVRIYTTDDITGIELGGSLKNIIAIGSGICDGANLGKNAQSAFITRGLVEITRFATYFGAEAKTMMGLAGIGDLIATCTSPLSRNYQFGQKLAEGQTLSKIYNNANNVIEGIHTTKIVMNIAKQHKINMPITEATYKVIQGEMKPNEAISELMNRYPTTE